MRRKAPQKREKRKKRKMMGRSLHEAYCAPYVRDGKCMVCEALMKLCPDRIDDGGSKSYLHGLFFGTMTRDEIVEELQGYPFSQDKVTRIMKRILVEHCLS